MSLYKIHIVSSFKIWQKLSGLQAFFSRVVFNYGYIVLNDIGLFRLSFVILHWFVKLCISRNFSISSTNIICQHVCIYYPLNACCICNDILFLKFLIFVFYLFKKISLPKVFLSFMSHRSDLVLLTFLCYLSLIDFQSLLFSSFCFRYTLCFYCLPIF